MRKMRRRALRAAVLGLVGAFAVAPLAHAATCVRIGAGGGTAVLTFAAGDGTVTLSNDGDAVTSQSARVRRRTAARRRSRTSRRSP